VGTWNEIAVCPDGTECRAGECVPRECERTCGERACGDDGCGCTAEQADSVVCRGPAFWHCDGETLARELAFSAPSWSCGCPSHGAELCHAGRAFGCSRGTWLDGGPIDPEAVVCLEGELGLRGDAWEPVVVAPDGDCACAPADNGCSFGRLLECVEGRWNLGEAVEPDEVRCVSGSIGTCGEAWEPIVRAPQGRCDCQAGALVCTEGRLLACDGDTWGPGVAADPNELICLNGELGRCGAGWRPVVAVPNGDCACQGGGEPVCVDGEVLECVDGVWVLSDGGGCEPELVGSFNVHDGPPWRDDPPTYSCLEACALLFGGVAAHYSCSIRQDVIDHRAYVDGWGERNLCQAPLPQAEDHKRGETYDCGDTGGSRSAYIDDHNECDGRMSYRFR